MPVPYGEKYWAQWAYEYVQIAQTNTGPNLVMAKARGARESSVASLVLRMRRKGLITPFIRGGGPPKLTPHAERILQRLGYDGKVYVSFDVEIHTNSKTEALAELWDVIQQLENWDDRQGEPFTYRPARMQTLGEENETNKGKH